MNCHILLRQNIQLHEYNVTNLSSELVSIVEEEERRCGLEVSINDQLCQACLMLVIREAANHDKDPIITRRGRLDTPVFLCAVEYHYLHKMSGVIPDCHRGV
ncbi:hypothetical protein evm_014586 [Chilo suppressalis]|nr:hypothetical protein evm_014586 [Chilo suppressalis]